MKKQFLLAFGLASMLLAGCSDSDNVADGGNTPDPNATGYLSLKVALPSTSGYAGRAATDATDQSNDQEYHGAAKEYKVQSIDLVCFDATNKVVKYLPLTDAELGWSTPSTPDSGTDGITTEKVLPVQEVPSTVASVLVLVNKPSLTIRENSTTFDDLYNQVLLSTVDLVGGASKDKFFMTNSPLSIGTDSTLLVKVQPQKTQAAAIADTRVVNVERAVGKVSLSHVTGGKWATTYDDWKYTLSATGYADDEVVFNNWILDNTNTKTYLIRHYNTAWESRENTIGQRFRSTTKNYVGSQGAMMARTYWAQDPNYNTDESLNAAGSIDGAMNDPQYCFENTFDVKRMKGTNTTRVLLEATYTPSGFTSGDTWYRVGEAIKARKADYINGLISQALANAGLSALGTVTVNEATLKAGKNEIKEGILLGLTAANKEDQIKAIKNALGSITAFKNGKCYYEVRVQHFGKKYTPWGEENGAPSVGGGGEKFYDYTSFADSELGTMENNYLGRYGIVRNNWYDLQLGEIKAPGSPTKPDLSDKADDEQKYYIQATVKIMDWAVRKQTVDL